MLWLVLGIVVACVVIVILLGRGVMRFWRRWWNR